MTYLEAIEKITDFNKYKGDVFIIDEIGEITLTHIIPYDIDTEVSYENVQNILLQIPLIIYNMKNRNCKILFVFDWEKRFMPLYPLYLSEEKFLELLD